MMRLVALCLACIAVMPLLGLLMLGQALVGSQRRALRMAVAIDQCGNAALGGSEDETISSRAWRAQQAGKLRGKVAVRVIDALFGKGHCERAQGV
jgi:hypothetical protein